MGAQTETTNIATPFNLLLENRGWLINNFNPTIHTSSVPDKWITHPEHGGRWLEYKVWYGDKLISSAKQQKRFRKLMDYGMESWVGIAEYLRGVKNYDLRMRMYDKLFQPPNGKYMLDKKLYHKLR